MEDKGAILDMLLPKYLTHAKVIFVFITTDTIRNVTGQT